MLKNYYSDEWQLAQNICSYSKILNHNLRWWKRKNRGQWV